MRFSTLSLVFVMLAATVSAEDIVLQDGRYLQVKILEPTPQGIRVQLMDTGGQIFLPWSLLCDADRDRLMIRYGYKEDESQRIPVEDGIRITTRKGDIYEGKLIDEAGDNVTFQNAGTKISLPKAAIAQIEKLPVPITAIYIPAEYYKRKLAEMNPADDDVESQMELARLAENLEEYESAAAHYLKVQASDPIYEKDLIKNKLERLEALSKNKQVRDAMSQVRRMIGFKQFVKTFLMLDEMKALPGLAPSLGAELDVLRERATKARYEYYRLLVRDDYEGTLKNKIRAMSRDPKLTLDEARRKARTDLHKEVVADVAARHGLDPKGDVEKMWSERGFIVPRQASYGSGTFIVLGKAPDAAKLEAELNRQLASLIQQQGGRNNNQNGSLSAQPQKLPKPPTKDEWWTKVSDSFMREQWILAFWVENAKKVTIDGETSEECPNCGSTGSLKFSGAQGETMRVTCPKCQGHKKNKVLRYR